MKLTYRGIHYDSPPDFAPDYGSAYAIGRYRGVAMPFRPLLNGPEPLRYSLMWRGTATRNNARVGSEVIPVEPSAEPSAESIPSAPAATRSVATSKPLDLMDWSRQLFLRRHERLRRREQAMLARLDAEVGLSVQDAMDYESHVQGKVPHDFSGYDRSHAAMS